VGLDNSLVRPYVFLGKSGSWGDDDDDDDDDDVRIGLWTKQVREILEIYKYGANL